MTSYTIRRANSHDVIDYDIQTNQVWLNDRYFGYTYPYEEEYGATKWAVERADGYAISGFNTHIKAHNWLIKHPPLEVEIVYSPDPLEELTATCQEYGFGLDVEGNVYQGERFLGKVGYCDRWWVIRQSSQHGEAVPCDSAKDAVWSLWATEAE